MYRSGVQVCSHPQASAFTLSGQGGTASMYRLLQLPLPLTLLRFCTRRFAAFAATMLADATGASGLAVSYLQERATAVASQVALALAHRASSCTSTFPCKHFAAMPVDIRAAAMASALSQALVFAGR